MYTAINGIYENGRLILTEAPPTDRPSKVLVMFLEEIAPSTPRKKRVLGGLRHLGGAIPDDFNEPL